MHKKQESVCAVQDLRVDSYSLIHNSYGHLLHTYTVHTLCMSPHKLGQGVAAPGAWEPAQAQIVTSVLRVGASLMVYCACVPSVTVSRVSRVSVGSAGIFCTLDHMVECVNDS